VILAIALVAALVAALLRGGRLQALALAPFQWGRLAVASFALQTLFIYRSPYVKDGKGWGWLEIAFVGSHLLLLGVVWANRHSPGMRWIGLGLLLNTAALVANGGWMPVSPEAVSAVGYAHLVPDVVSGLRFPQSKNIVLAIEETNLPFLSDVFVLHRPFPFPSVFSPGDILVAVGAFMWVQTATGAQQRRTVSIEYDGGAVK